MDNSNKTVAMCCIECGGALRFDSTLGKLKCEYCDSTYTNEEVEAHFKAQEQKEAEKESGADWGKESETMVAYSCSTCGAEIITEENTAAMRCPYCGNSTIVPAQFEGAIRPDYVIPFAFDKKQAEEKYKSYYVKRWLLPKSFLNDNKVEEIQGVYVPFWLYNGTVSVDAEYVATDTTEKDDKEIIKYYNVQRKGNIAFKNVPTDASKRMPDDLMDSVEPYKYDGLKPFSITYLPGFLAERFNVSEEEDRERAEKRVKETARQKTRETVGHDSIEKETEHLTVHYTDKKYALLPVWYLTTRWNEKQWRFAMNGQTGEFTGDLPIDKLKMTMMVAIAFLIPFLICALGFHKNVLGVILGLVVAGIASLIAYGTMKPVSKASSAEEYMKKLYLTVETEQFVKTVTKPKKK